jgi:hypothetical protein
MLDLRSQSFHRTVTKVSSGKEYARVGWARRAHSPKSLPDMAMGTDDAHRPSYDRGTFVIGAHVNWSLVARDTRPKHDSEQLPAQPV